MTDPEFADAPTSSRSTSEVLTQIIERERPDAVLPTLGGQTALNLAMAARRARACSTTYGVELIGANAEAIATAEDRERFKAGDERDRPARCPRRASPTRSTRRSRSSSEIGLPGDRPARVHPRRPGHRHRVDADGVRARSPRAGLDASPICEILIERSIVGWKEFELEVMRDRADNCVVVCSIENFDPMGVHTGDSITVAPAQTLTDVEYQAMRDAAFACIRRVGVETGGTNMQFAVDPTNGDMVVIEMNPRVSRSSALASKATGLPDRQDRGPARGRLHARRDPERHHPEDARPASSRPSTTSSPRCRGGRSRSFPGTSGVLGTQMQSVGEAMAIGRTFPESLQKGLRSLETGRLGLNCDPGEAALDAHRRSTSSCARSAIATPDRPFQLEAALRRGCVGRAARRGHRDRSVVPRPDRRASSTSARASTSIGFDGMTRRVVAAGQAARVLRRASSPTLFGVDRGRGARRAARAGVAVTFKTVDTCGAEFEAEHAVPLLDLRGRGRGAPAEQPADRHPRLGPEPHRPGHRVRLLLRARRLRAARRRLRDDHGQLQPRDGVDRLRHERPPLLRAAHARGRAQRHRGRAADRA